MSRTSDAFSPKMARSSFSSGVIGLSPLGVTLPTRMSPGWTSAPMATMPASSRLRRASSPTLGMSRVISSGPSLVSRAIDLELLDVDRGEDVVGHDPLGDQDRVLEVVAVPRHEGDEGVAAQRQLAQLGRGAVGDDVARADLVAHAHQRTLVDAGRLVGALELRQAVDVDARLGRVGLLGGAHHDPGAVDLLDHARRGGRPRSRRNRGPPRPPCRCRPAARRPVTSGTAWRCMFEPISARLASSFSRNGIRAAATDTTCLGDTSMKSTVSRLLQRHVAVDADLAPGRRSSSPSSPSVMLAWAMTCLASSMADM